MPCEQASGAEWCDARRVGDYVIAETPAGPTGLGGVGRATSASSPGDC